MTSHDKLRELAERLETFDGEVDEMDALLNEAAAMLRKMAAPPLVTLWIRGAFG